MARKNSNRVYGRSHPHRPRTGELKVSRSKRVIFSLITLLLVLVLAEGIFAIALRISEGEWPYTRLKHADYLLFQPDPELGMMPRKDVTVAVLGKIHHHNLDGFRGNEFTRVKTTHRIACIGGSTTYGIGVGDDETWPFYLDQLLQPDCEVLNFGVPAHSSVEHKKLLPQILARYSPDIVIFQLGLNDLRNMNLADPGPDYQNFHQPCLRFSTGEAFRRERLPRSALLHGAVILLEKAGVLQASPFPGGEPPGRVSDSVDPRVVEIFSSNLDILLRECLAKHIPVVLLPHTLSPEVITETNYKWWVPYLTKKGIFNALDAMNAVMQGKADGQRVIYAGFINGEIWSSAEFCDPSHLNAQGNLRLARLLKEELPWSQLRGHEKSSTK